ncbi:MAG TPA: hypothetical protein VND64_26475 [Pirellulales bacterium]|nr:hypothetical protein [Pirellulales bacterium]
MRDLASMGLSYYAVSGSGQERKRFFLVLKLIEASNEESFVVQPRSEMDESIFRRNLLMLINKYDQDFAAVKLPSGSAALLLFRNDDVSPLGDTASPRKPDDPFYSELRKGPRTSIGQLSTWESRGERNVFAILGNWVRGRADLNQAIPAEQRGGRRFTICWNRPERGGENV